MIGRPQAIIDWRKVDNLLVAGSSGVQIAGELGINPNTLYEHTLREKGIPFSEYSQQKYSKGESLIKAKQFEVGMKGNTTMLIWLGKQRCDQRENDNTKAQIPQENLIDIQNRLMKAEALLQKHGISYESKTKSELPGSDASL